MIGTRVGGGVIAGGRPIDGSAHPKAGYIRVRRRGGDASAGACSFHGDCLEGLVSDPALARRTGLAGDAIPEPMAMCALLRRSAPSLTTRHKDRFEHEPSFALRELPVGNDHHGHMLTATENAALVHRRSRPGDG